VEEKVSALRVYTVVAADVGRRRFMDTRRTVDGIQQVFGLSSTFDSRYGYCVVDIEFASQILQNINLADMIRQGSHRRQEEYARLL
jgi:hypothetical protein